MREHTNIVANRVSLPRRTRTDCVSKDAGLSLRVLRQRGILMKQRRSTSKSNPRPERDESANRNRVGDKEGVRSDKHQHYEFGGPFGALGVMLGLPIVMCGLMFFCRLINHPVALLVLVMIRCGVAFCALTYLCVCVCVFVFRQDYCVRWSSPLQSPPPLSSTQGPSYSSCLVAVAVVLLWCLLQVLLERLLPGDVVEGVKLKTGKRLKYCLNGHKAFWVCVMLLLLAWVPAFKHILSATASQSDTMPVVGVGKFRLSWAYDHFLELMLVSILFSFVLSAIVYGASFVNGALLAVSKSGHTCTVVFVPFS